MEHTVFRYAPERAAGWINEPCLSPPLLITVIEGTRKASGAYIFPRKRQVNAR